MFNENQLPDTIKYIWKSHIIGKTKQILQKMKELGSLEVSQNYFAKMFFLYNTSTQSEYMLLNSGAVQFQILRNVK